MNKKVKITEIPIDNLNYEEVLEHVDQFIVKKRKVYIVTANPEMLLDASEDDDFLEVLKGAELITPDGTGILWAANYLHSPKPKWRIFQYLQLFGSLISIFFFFKRKENVLKERVTGADLFPKIIDQSQNRGWRIFLLGASKGVAKIVIEKFSKIYPNAYFAGSFVGSPDEMYEEDICDKINEVKPDILFVAYGSPSQEFWIHRNLFKLDSVKIAMGVGGAFDFHAGKIRRAPKWMQKFGLEWLWRFICEPRRISRIWNATFMFVKLIAGEKIKR